MASLEYCSSTSHTPRHRSAAWRTTVAAVSLQRECSPERVLSKAAAGAGGRIRSQDGGCLQLPARLQFHWCMPKRWACC